METSSHKNLSKYSRGLDATRETQTENLNAKRQAVAPATSQATLYNLYYVKYIWVYLT
jgi:hypothetical protein